MGAPESKHLVVRFEESNVAKAGILAESLRDTLRRTHPDVVVERRREDESAMEFGTTLIVLLGTPAIVAIAKGLQSWLKRNQSASVCIETSDGKVVIENVTGAQAVDLAKALGKV